MPFTIIFTFGRATSDARRQFEPPRASLGAEVRVVVVDIVVVAAGPSAATHLRARMTTHRGSKRSGIVLSVKASVEPKLWSMHECATLRRALRAREKDI